MKENELAEITANWIRTLDRDGRSGKTSLHNLLLGTVMYRGVVTYNDEESINKAIDTGFYVHHGSVYGTSSGHGILLVLNTGLYITQFILSNKLVLLMRFSSDKGGNWSSWKSTAFT